MPVDTISNAIQKLYTNDIPRDISSYFIKIQGNVNNRESLSLINSMGSTYAPPKYRLSNFNIKNKAICEMRKISKFYWDIVFTKEDVKFYLSMDEPNEELIVTKAKNVWSRCNISKMPITKHDLKILDSKTDSSKCACSEIVLKTYNYKSISTDISNQYPLTNMFSIIKVLKKDEFVRVNIAIEPTSRIDWIAKAKDEKKMFDSGKILNNEIGLKEQMIKLGMDASMLGLELYIELKMIPIECIFGLFLNSDMDLSKKDKKLDRKRKDFATRFDMYGDDDDIIESSFRRRSGNNYKSTAETFKTKITIISQSDDIDRARINMIAVGNSYKDLTEDNELVMRIYEDKETDKAIKEIKNQDVVINKKCILSDKELCKLIQLPQKTLQDEYKMDVINTRESDIPKILQGGSVRIMEVDEPSNNRKTMVTFPKDTNLMARKTIYMGGENSGKTTALKRTVKDCHNAGISTFAIDNLENCKMTTEVGGVIPDNEKIIYDVYEQMPPMAFTEVSKLITEDMDKQTRIDYANMISEMVEYFINGITDDTTTGKLSANMLRYLHSACMVTFIKPKATIGDAFDVLRRWDKRNDYIRYAKYSELFDEDDDIFFDLNELHKREDKGKIVGTREDLIVGIVNRITLLNKNPRIKTMLKKPYDENDDIDNHIQQGKAIFVKIPQNKFPNPVTRDILSTFYLTRLWLTVQIREENKDSKLCNLVLDEIKTVPTVADFLEKNITEFRRHRLGMLLSCHGLSQFGKLLTQLLDSGANFIIMPPCDKKNLEALKDEMKPFTVDECLELKPHHALGIINYGNQYWKGIGRLPKI